MQVYIRSSGNISPAYAMDRDKDLFFGGRENRNGKRLKAIEPDYSRYVDNKMIRRMSRIVKMGVAASAECLRNAGTDMPEAIITGTAYGCLEDTGIFLRRMIDNKEELLTPTAFIQSTHNTVGAQIALLLKCHGYNNSIVHGGFSFENALTDARLLLHEGMDNILAGAIDEITDDSHAILNRLGLYRQETVAGEGASFFLLSRLAGHGAMAALHAHTILYKPHSFPAVENRIHQYLEESSLSLNDIDLVISGKNGDRHHDEIDEYLSAGIFQHKMILPFKQFCGEYPTASGFALWLAAKLISGQKSPEGLPQILFPLKNILIHNHYDNAHHALFLISAC